MNDKLIDSLRQEYRVSFSDKAKACENLWLAGKSQRGELLRFLHRLAGSAGMYGYPEISRLAIQFKNTLESARPDDELKAHYESLYRQLINYATPDTHTG